MIRLNFTVITFRRRTLGSMYYSVFLAYVIALVVSAVSLKGSFDLSMATTALWHSENAYCSPDTYLTRPNKGALAGFVPVYTVNDPAHDTQGYIGYTASQSTIYVSFRGSQSTKNWISNLDAVLTDYPLCANCKVHKGFYTAEQNSIAQIISQVKTLKQQFPSYQIVVTGHSLGAALATLTAIDIQAAVGPVRLFNFGSPRIGDPAFSVWASGYLADHNRITHHKDMVVHTPTGARLQHISGEWYEPDNAVSPVAVSPCSGYEDPKCSYQWYMGNIDDHLWYMGVTLGADGCTAIL